MKTTTTRNVLFLSGLVLAACRTSPIPQPPAPAITLEARVEEQIAYLVDAETRNEARREILALGKEAVPVLITHAHDADPAVRWEIAEVLGTIADPRSLPVVVDLAVSDANPQTRLRALWAIARFTRPEAVTALSKELSSPQQWRSWNAAVALSMFYAPEGLEILHAGVRSPDPWRRWEAINALGRVHNAETVGFLAPALASPSVRDRKETALSLGLIGTPEAAALLVQALDDPSPEVRWRAAMSLGRAGDRSVTAKLQHLAASDSDATVRRHALRALAKIRR